MWTFTELEGYDSLTWDELDDDERRGARNCLAYIDSLESHGVTVHGCALDVDASGSGSEAFILRTDGDREVRVEFPCAPLAWLHSPETHQDDWAGWDEDGGLREIFVRGEGHPDWEQAVEAGVRVARARDFENLGFENCMAYIDGLRDRRYQPREYDFNSRDDSARGRSFRLLVGDFWLTVRLPGAPLDWLRFPEANEDERLSWTSEGPDGLDIVVDGESYLDWEQALDAGAERIRRGVGRGR